MATRGKLEVDIDVKSNPDKLWGASMCIATELPKIFPNMFKAVEILEGDGKSPGSVIRHISYGEDGSLESLTEKVETFDDAKKTYIFTIVDGYLLRDYKKFKGRISVTPKGDGSEVNWSVEYEKVTQEVPDPIIMKDAEVKRFLEMDAYLQNA